MLTMYVSVLADHEGISWGIAVEVKICTQLLPY